MSFPKARLSFEADRLRSDWDGASLADGGVGECESPLQENAEPALNASVAPASYVRAQEIDVRGPCGYEHSWRELPKH